MTFTMSMFFVFISTHVLLIACQNVSAFMVQSRVPNFIGVSGQMNLQQTTKFPNKHLSPFIQTCPLSPRTQGAHSLNSAVTTDILLASGVEGIRQYVPLVVSCLVIVDILLGNPFATMIMAPLRPDIEGESGKDSSVTEEAKKKERVDTEAMVKQALDKARNQQDLRDYLEANKTDQQRFDDLRKTIDRQMANIDKDPPTE
mmetsp:Transcript_17616/g.17828  ORF Transcript_17616/g.17828 Transcript_17616/m.17828 type:complete len:201 (-) Transcript_17616:131-733(-)